MTLLFGEIDPTEPKGIPPRALNGGLYTGEPFAMGAPWGNVPITPEANVLVGAALHSANPPPRAMAHVPGNTRIGNNTQTPLFREAYDPKVYPGIFTIRNDINWNA